MIKPIPQEYGYTPVDGNKQTQEELWAEVTRLRKAINNLTHPGCDCDVCNRLRRIIGGAT